MNVFLIFEYVPEETKMYYIPDVSDEDLGILDNANGNYVNTDSSDEAVEAAIRVMDFISEDRYCEKPGCKTNSKWLKYEIKYSADDKGPAFNIWDKEALEGSRPSKTIDRVYLCGMIM